MGAELFKIGVQIRKAVIFSIRTSFRSVCRHPFLVGTAFFLIFMYRSFPLMFSLLVSASPVLVSTAILLGTLLSFGQPNIPEIEKEEKTTHEIGSLKAGIPRDAVVVEEDESYTVERYSELRRDLVEKSIEEASWTAKEFSEVDKKDSLIHSDALIEKSRELQFDKREIEGDRELSNMVFELENNLNHEKHDNEELMGHHYTPIPQLDEISLHGSESDKSPEVYLGYQAVDPISSPRGSPWKHEAEEEEEDGEASDSEYDRAESSSPDASMGDIIPLLDELHPLLDEDSPQPAHVSHEGSGVASEHSSKSLGEGSNESDEDMENNKELEGGDDEEEEEETHGDKEDETKSPIRWTEDDQKNLMDLGTSELERNQRLESLIARRRARKSMRMMAEKNLIDFDSTDLPFSVAPISIARRNPFDLPYDQNDMGLPPIPGSAPSIMAPRRNPFDIPYDSSEEKPDLMGDSFQQDFVTFQPKEPLFRRRESFNVGPSIFGTYRQDLKFKPYFFPERLTSEGSSYSPFHRQSSDLSDSKVSSVPETESVVSAEDLEDEKPIDEDIPQEPELISTEGHGSKHVGHGSKSSEDVDSFELGRSEKRDLEMNEVEVKLVGLEDHQEVVSSLPETISLGTPIDFNASETHLNTEAVELKYSSSSSLSEVEEEIFSEKEDERLLIMEPSGGDLIEEPGIPQKPALEKSDRDISNQLVDDTRHKEPVYDSSPTAVEKNLSSYYISSDLQAEIFKTKSPPFSIKRTISFTERDSEVSDQIIEKNTPGIEADEVVSAHFRSITEERSMLQSEKELPLSDKSVYESSPDNAEELQDSTTYLKSLEFQVDHRVYRYINYPTLEPKSMKSEATEPNAVVLPDVQECILDKFENVEQIQVLEEQCFPVEATDSHVSMQNKVEEVDDMKEIDEEILLELDTVGDFSIKGVGSNLNKTGEERFPMLHDVGNSSEDVNGDNVGIHETKVTLGDDDDLRASKVEEEMSKFQGEMEDALELQMPVIRSIELEDSSIKEIVHREVEDLTASISIIGDPVPEKTAAETAGSRVMRNSYAEEINSDMPVDEMQSINVVESNFKETEPVSAEMDVHGLITAEPDVGMTVVEAQTLEDINSSFLRVNEKDMEKSVVKSSHADMTSETTLEPDVGMTVVEARTLEDINSSLLRVTEKDMEKSVVKSSHADMTSETALEPDVGMAVVEARTLEDINSSFLQVTEKDMEKSVVKSSHADMTSETTTARSNDNTSDLTVHEASLDQDGHSDFEQLEGIVEGPIVSDSIGNDQSNVISQDPVDNPSEVHVVEARSTEDANIALVKDSVYNIEKVPKSDSEEGSEEIEVNKVSSDKGIESSINASGIEENSSATTEKRSNEGKTSEDSSASDTEVEKADSHSSSSSSSSSSGSSDSDKE